jgi:hypothetical protein
MTFTRQETHPPVRFAYDPRGAAPSWRAITTAEWLVRLCLASHVRPMAGPFLVAERAPHHEERHG